MSRTWKPSQDELQDVLRRNPYLSIAKDEKTDSSADTAANRGIPGGGSGSKFGNIPEEVEGRKHDSRKEAKDARAFRLLGKAGEIVAYATQVDIYLPGGIVMRVDHLLIRRDGDQWVLDWKDSKGGKATVTADWRNKQKLAKATHDIDVETI